jgi:hypothetical protein
MRRDFEAFATNLARHIIVDPHQMVFALLEDHAVVCVRAARNLSLPGPAHPADRVVAAPAAAGALEPRRALLGLLGKELAFVHDVRVHEVSDESEARGLPG